MFTPAQPGLLGSVPMMGMPYDMNLPSPLPPPQEKTEKKDIIYRKHEVKEEDESGDFKANPFPQSSNNEYQKLKNSQCIQLCVQLETVPAPALSVPAASGRESRRERGGRKGGKQFQKEAEEQRKTEGRRGGERSRDEQGGWLSVVLPNVG